MRFGQTVGMLIAAAVILPLIAANAAAPELTVLLPSDSAIAAGADFNALCENPQSADFFSMLEDSGGQSVKELAELLVATDSHGKKRVLIAGFDSAERVEQLCRKAAGKRIPAEDHENYQVYLLKGAVTERKAVRMVPLSEKIFGIFSAFPAGQKFQVTSGVSAVDIYAPRRSGILLWGWGRPEVRGKYLEDLKEFSFALEENFAGKLTFHGYMRFSSALQTRMFLLVVYAVIPVFLNNKYQIPREDAIKAIEALQSRCQGEFIYFSSSNMEPVFKVLGSVLKQPLSILREIAE